MKAISLFLSELKSDLAKNMRSRDQDRRGKIGASLRVEIDDKGGSLYGWRWLLTRIEFGRGPTKNRSAGTPTLRERIEKWVEENNIGEPKRRKSIAYAITRKIHEKGDRMYRGEHPLGRPSGTFYQLLKDGRVEDLKKEIAVTLRADILDIYKKMGKDA